MAGTDLIKEVFKMPDLIRLCLVGSAIVFTQYLTVKFHLDDSYAHIDEQEHIAIQEVIRGFPYNSEERKLVHDSATLIAILASKLDDSQADLIRYRNEGRLQSPEEKLSLWENWLNNNRLKLRLDSEGSE